VLQEGLRHLVAGPSEALIEAERDFLSRALRLLQASTPALIRPCVRKVESWAGPAAAAQLLNLVKRGVLGCGLARRGLPMSLHAAE
jgi:hypothetical protein